MSSYFPIAILIDSVEIYFNFRKFLVSVSFQTILIWSILYCHLLFKQLILLPSHSHSSMLSFIIMKNTIFLFFTFYCYYHLLFPIIPFIISYHRSFLVNFSLLFTMQCFYFLINSLEHLLLIFYFFFFYILLAL